MHHVFALLMFSLAGVRLILIESWFKWYHYRLYSIKYPSRMRIIWKLFVCGFLNYVVFSV